MKLRIIIIIIIIITIIIIIILVVVVVVVLFFFFFNQETLSPGSVIFREVLTKKSCDEIKSHQLIYHKTRQQITGD